LIYSDHRYGLVQWAMSNLPHIPANARSIRHLSLKQDPSQRSLELIRKSENNFSSRTSASCEGDRNRMGKCVY